MKTCLICRHYTDKQQNTLWWCSQCHVPLCNKPRGREVTCYQEHIDRTDDPVLGCFARDVYPIYLPPQYRLYHQNKDVPHPPPLPSPPSLFPSLEDNDDGSSSSSSDLSDISAAASVETRQQQQPAAPVKKMQAREGRDVTMVTASESHMRTPSRSAAEVSCQPARRGKRVRR